MRFSLRAWFVQNKLTTVLFEQAHSTAYITWYVSFAINNVSIILQLSQLYSLGLVLVVLFYLLHVLVCLNSIMSGFALEYADISRE